MEKEYELSSGESDVEKGGDKDSFELPEVDFLVTPVLLRNNKEKNTDLVHTVTPESVVQEGMEKRKKEVKKQGILWPNSMFNLVRVITCKTLMFSDSKLYQSRNSI